MSDAHADHESHEGPIKTPQQLIWTVVLSFVVPIIAIILLVNYVTSNSKPAAGSDAMSAEAVAERLQRVGQVKVKNPNDPSAMASGEAVYNGQCAACHGSGAAGAPKFGDAAAWAPRIKTGYDALLTSALKGKGSMGAQGGGDYSDTEIGRAVVYMANKAGAKFDEPKVAGAATAAAGDAAPALYTQICGACHAAGVAGAPKFGDKAAWAPRLAAGVDGLTASVVKGKGAMPAKGGAATASDADIKAAVTYMVNAAK